MDDFLLFAAGAFVGYLLAKMSGRSQAESAPPPAPPDADALEQVKPVLQMDGKIAAIKKYREITGVGLRDAKLAVDTLDASEPF